MAKGPFSGGLTVRDAAKLLGLTTALVRAYVRAGFLEPTRGPRGEHRFSLQDLVLLRTAKEISAHVPARRVRRALARLRAQLPSGRPLTGVRITAVGEDVVVRDGSAAWEPESGQGVLDFDVAELADKVAPLVRRAAAAARDAEDDLTAEEWFQVAFDLEPHEPDQARDAYRRALELDPDHVDAHVNLGRLLHEAGHAEAAATHYRAALTLRPKDATAAFNLGVALEDLGRTSAAAAAYERALAADASSADAHFNLARLLERAGRKAAAIRHLEAYRRLVRR
ncbi:MAG: tetratricopeptide repeat protein [Acidobacteria bacterium]|nr:tetratricopeptide repeat protein [Acidobacteriota bacterium]